MELLPKYAAWAEGVLAAGGAQQDDVLMYVMLWRIDAGDYAGALEIGASCPASWLGDAAG
ncbi:small terminase subunit [Escherichia coli]|nr:small terminase subunit [Escherichia coli]